MTLLKVLEMINDLDDYETEWNDWERKFIDSIKDKAESEETFMLTEPQQLKLEEIHRKYIKPYSV